MPDKRVHRSLPALPRGELEHGIPSIVRQRQHLDEERGVLGRRPRLSEERVEFVEFRLQRIVPRKAGGAFHLVDDWVKRAVGVLRRAETTDAEKALALETFGEARPSDAIFRCQPRRTAARLGLRLLLPSTSGAAAIRIPLRGRRGSSFRSGAAPRSGSSRNLAEAPPRPAPAPQFPSSPLSLGPRARRDAQEASACLR